MPLNTCVRPAGALAVCCLFVGFGFPFACSSSSRRGDEIDTDDAETSQDSETGSDIDTGSETGTDTGTETVADVWTWIQPPLDHFGWFTDISGRASDDVIATGYFFSLSGFDTHIQFNGLAAFYDDVVGEPDLQGTGMCTSNSGVYYMGAFGADPPNAPRFFTQQDSVWEEIAFDSDLCAGGSWFFGFTTDLSGRSITCFEPEGFAALVSCYVPPQGPPPGETFIHLVVHDSQGWTTPYSFSTTSDSFPNAAVWGQSADDLFFFVAEPEAPGYHFNGLEMTPVTPPPGYWFFSGDGGVKAMSGTRASQGTDLGFWLTGSYANEELDPWRQRGFVWRSPDGMTWSDVEVPLPPSSLCSEYFDDILVSDSEEVFVVGVRYCPPEYDALPLLLGYSGEEWEEIDIPPHPLSAGEIRGKLERIWSIGNAIFIATIVKELSWMSETPAILRYQPE